ncbi:MAG: spore maturation protein [Firmicutes bacterium]|nr:spore maturation protein [Bacillota bacterium]
MGVLSTVSTWALPMTLAFILLSGVARRVPVYDSFVTGAKEGFGTAISLIPQLIAMMVAVSVFRASGALTMLVRALDPLLHLLHFPPELLPLALLRPISGSASLALVIDVFKIHGPDSFLGKIASVMQGSTDTTMYVLTVYFGSVGIRNPRYAVKVGLLSDLVSVIASVFFVTWMLQ